MRIVVIGTSGSGKTTLAKQLANHFNLPHVGATTLLWLDYPFGLIIWRLLFRTLRRSILREELWNGNREKLWWHFVTKDSLFLWAFQTHWRRRKTFLDAFIGPEHSHLKVLRMRSPGATKKWLKEATAYKVQGNN